MRYCWGGWGALCRDTDYRTAVSHSRRAGCGCPRLSAHFLPAVSPASSCSSRGLGDSHDSSRSDFETGREPLKSLISLVFVGIF